MFFCFVMTACAPVHRGVIPPGASPYASRDVLTAYLQGLYAQEVGNPDRAFQEFAKAYVLDPHPRILEHLFAVAAQANRMKELLPVFDEVLNRNPNHLDLLFLQAELRTQYGHLAEAIRHYQKAQSLDPQDSRIPLELGRIYRIQGRSEEAEEALERTLTLESESIEAMVHLSILWEEDGKIEKAIALLEKALALDPSRLQSVRNLGRILEKTQRNSDTEKVYKLFLKKRPAAAVVRRDLADFYYRHNQWASAEAQYRELARGGVRTLEVFELLGLSLLKQNRPSEALALFKRALEISPGESILLLHQIQALIDLKRYSQATADLKSFLSKEDGASPNLWHQLGMLQYQHGDAADAVESFHRAFEQNPRDPEAAYFWGTAAALNEKNEEALQAFRVVLRIKPDHEGAAFQLGVVLERLGDTKAAVTAFRKVIRLNPENGDAYNYIGYTYAEAGNNLDEAEALVRRALVLSPKNSAYMDSLGWIQFQRKQYEEAIKSLEQAVQWAQETGTEDAVLYDHLGSALYQSGNPKKALVHWQKALGLSPGDADLRRKVKAGVP